MSDNLKKQPKKGILKNSSSFDHEEKHKDKGTKFDEMNIIATLHPKDKDYGHMKIEEPKTPYNYDGNDSGDEIDGLDVDLLAEKIKIEGSDGPKVLKDSIDESSEEEEEISPEEEAKRKAFEMKRKHHYNEFAAVKLARKLMEQDTDTVADEDKIEEEVEDVNKESNTSIDQNVKQTDSG